MSDSTRIAGLAAPATIRRDAYGIPHIAAANEADLFFAFGWVQAQDRGWQCDFNRRVPQGRLAEWGNQPAFLANDRWFRTLGFAQIAEQIWAMMPSDTQRLLAAFTAGINAWLTAHPTRTEAEYQMLQCGMEPWQPTDSLAVLRLIGWWLAGDYEKEKFAWDLTQAVGPSLSAILYPDIPDAETCARMRATACADGDPPTWSAASAPRIPYGLSNQDHGTNLWVIDGTRTASGQPILANDPHLNLFAPGVWYEAHLECPTFHATGFTFPGLPFFAIGHNESVAWGASNWPADTQDLAIEEVDFSERQVRAADGTWTPLVVREEHIVIRGAEPEVLPVLSTPRGPLVQTVSEDRALSLRWSGFTPTDEVTVFLNAARASTLAEFQAAFAEFGTPTQNFYAFDRSGAIGALHAGQVPTRSRGETSFPQSAHDPGTAWGAPIPAADLGPAIGSPSGFLANANNKPVECAWPTGCRFTPPYRYSRVVSLLRGRTDWTLAATIAMQNDTLNLSAMEILHLLRAFPLDGQLTSQDPLWHQLLTWDGDHRNDPAACALFHEFLLALARSLILPLVGPAVWQGYQDQQDAQFLLVREWLRDPAESPLASVVTGNAPAVRIHQAFADALSALQASQGPDPSQWDWAAGHQLNLKHPLSLPGLGAGTVPHPGGRHTLNVANCNPSQGWQCYHGVSLRFVATLDAAGRPLGHAIVLPGNGGQPGQAHFADQLPLYLEGELRPMLFWPEEIAALEIAEILAPLEG